MEASKAAGMQAGTTTRMSLREACTRVTESGTPKVQVHSRSERSVLENPSKAPRRPGDRAFKPSVKPPTLLSFEFRTSSTMSCI